MPSAVCIYPEKTAYWIVMQVLKICRKCSKPDRSSVVGKPRSGKGLVKRLRGKTDLPFKVKSCGCLGKCKKGPNGLLEPEKKRLFRLTMREIRRLGDSHSQP